MLHMYVCVCSYISAVSYQIQYLFIECSISYNWESKACFVICRPPAEHAAIKVNESWLRLSDSCRYGYLPLEYPSCLWRKDGMSAGAMIRSNLGRTRFMYDPQITSCDEWCELNIEFGEFYIHVNVVLILLAFHE